MWCGNHTGFGWLGWTLMSVGMIAFWGLVAWAIVVFIRGGNTRDNGDANRSDEVLASRFASGEISADEYVRARDLLDGGPAQPKADESVEAL